MKRYKLIGYMLAAFAAGFLLCCILSSTVEGSVFSVPDKVSAGIHYTAARIREVIQ